MRIRHFFLILLLCFANSACRQKTPTPTGTGTHAVVASYFDALVKQDWDGAYAQLHADTRKQMDRSEFERRARGYCQQLGFPLGAFFVRSCDEQGTKAIAHVTLSDANNSAKHRYREGVVLQSTANGWAIVLPANFGKR